MANVRIKCPVCGKLLSADDKYLRYTVSCGLCHSTFVFDSICIDGNQGTIPVFPAFEQHKQSIEIDSTVETQEQSISQLDAIKTGKLAKAIITYSLEKHLLDEAEIKCFSDSAYTRKRFHFKYPLFQIFPEDSIDKASLITKGHNRYYQNPVMVDGKAFFICKEWFDYNRQELLSWGLSKGLTITSILELVEEIQTNNATENGEIRQGISQISGDGRKKANTIVTTDKEASFFKIFNKSVFVIGITIPNELRKTFLSHLSTNDLQNGIPHRVSVKIGDEVYDAYVLKANQKNGCYFWRLQWSKGAPIAVYLQKKYKNIYAALEENPQVSIPSNFGIIVKATEAIDVFEIVCTSDDISEEQKTYLLNQHIFSNLETTNEDIIDDKKNDNVKEFTFCMDSPPNDLSYCKPTIITIADEKTNVSTWKSLLVTICQYLYKNRRDYILLLINEKMFKAIPKWCFQDSQEGLNSPYKMDDNLWFSTCLSTNQIISLSIEILNFCEYPLEKIIVSYFLPAHKKRHRNGEMGVEAETANGIEEEDTEIEDDVDATSGNASFDAILERWGEDNL